MTDTLTHKIEARPSADELKQRNILPGTFKVLLTSRENGIDKRDIMIESNAAPALLAAQQELARNKLQDTLEKKMESRPEKDQLVEQNILKGLLLITSIVLMDRNWQAW